MLAHGNNKTVSSSRLKMSSKLSESLHRNLGAYALAAGAAGVAVLACSVPADAAPVCKNPHLTIPGTNTYALNPAGQQIAPFNIVDTFNNPSSNSFGWWNRGFFTPNSAGANAVLDKNGFPADLAAGASIGPAAQFGPGKSYGLLFTYGYGSGRRGRLKDHQGNLQFGQDNYFGFKFSVSGQVHYGWVRLHVTFGRGTDGQSTSTHILSYGYESTPNTAILAGSCNASIASAGPALEDQKANVARESSSSDHAATVASTTGDDAASASLGLLALGSEGIPLWRRKQM
jgi:hypothetical protein